MAPKRKFKRILVVGDTHCGHRVGLTPPKYQSAIPGKKYYYTQVETWDLYRKWINELQPIDIVFGLGDMVDGKGYSSGGSELLTTDAKLQCEIAIACIEPINAKKHLFVYGTPYHVGTSGEDYEREIAEYFGGEIKSQAWCDVNGTVFDLKHQSESGTSLPTGKGTPLSKEWLWNLIWHDQNGQQPKADVFIRAHAHYAFQVSEPNRWMAIAIPALQAAGTKYGARRRSGVVHFGLVCIDCYPDGEYTISWRIAPVESRQERIRKF
jgi:hypothetical protein